MKCEVCWQEIAPDDRRQVIRKNSGMESSGHWMDSQCFSKLKNQFPDVYKPSMTSRSSSSK